MTSLEFLDFLTLDGLGKAIRWFVLGVGIAFAYYVVYSLRRLRANVHYMANQLQLMLGTQELSRAQRDADSRPRTPARR